MTVSLFSESSSLRCLQVMTVSCHGTDKWKAVRREEWERRIETSIKTCLRNDLGVIDVDMMMKISSKDRRRH